MLHSSVLLSQSAYKMLYTQFNISCSTPINNHTHCANSYWQHHMQSLLIYLIESLIFQYTLIHKIDSIHKLLYRER